MEQQQQMAALFDGVAESYDNVGVEFFRPIASGLVAELDPQVGERVLDIGCGRGAVLCAIAPGVGPTGSVTGIDVSPRMVEAATMAATDAGVSAEIRVGDAMAPAYSPESFDVIASSLVLFFLPDPLAALAAWHALLAPSGRLGVTTFGPADDRWTGLVMASMRAHTVSGADNTRASNSGPFESDEAMEALVTEAGYQGVRTAAGVISPRFDDCEHWFRWSMSAGQRRFWQSIPESRFDEVKADMFAAVDQCRDEQDRIGFDQRLRYTLAAH